ncbi:MAG: ferritin-like domain-containing protein [Proteobacteria bacterium]|nr:ferritin-like domain-containing protein [Pseudomonadota bacterium]
MENTPEPPDEGRRALWGGRLAGAALAGAAGAAQAQIAARQEPPPPGPRRGVTDVDVFNFALNLEYLETEYYMRGLTGRGLDGAIAGRAPGPVTGGGLVRFENPVIRQFMENILDNEVGHVRYYQRVLGGEAISRPALDFAGGFAAVAQAAGLGPNFDPFANETSFLLGGYLFEDMGITVYKGASPLIRNRDNLKAAAAVLATEAYHMGVVRSVLFRKGPEARAMAQRISDLRDTLDGPAELDQPLEVNGRANIVPSDSAAIAFSRTPEQALNIVYGQPGRGVRSGGFFPQGLNGRIQTS